ncbi:MAG: NAD(P)-dependent oxidoreductase [Pseudomonadota bacterium]|nr:NAD(P)-dependent oxidoreductase [Pseudomonadota bacterium]
MRILLDEKLASDTEDLFAAAGIKTDILKLRQPALETLVRHGKYSALVVRDKTRISGEVMEAAGKSLKIIGVVADSLVNLNVMEATRHGIIVKITEYGNSYEAANLTKRLFIYVLSKSFQKRDAQEALVLKDVESIVPDSYTGFELADKTVGLIGCGRVAQALAMQIEPHCKCVLGHDSHPEVVYRNHHLTNPLEHPLIEYCQFIEIAEEADVVSIHTSGDEKVRGMEEIYRSDRMPFIVDTSRNETCHRSDLLSALSEERIQGAAFTVPYQDLIKGDVEESLKPFLSFGNVVIAPALGKPTGEAHRKNSRTLVRSVINYLLKQDLSLAVNPPKTFGGKEEQRYPLSVRSRRVSTPLRL